MRKELKSQESARLSHSFQGLTQQQLQVFQVSLSVAFSYEHLATTSGLSNDLAGWGQKEQESGWRFSFVGGLRVSTPRVSWETLKDTLSLVVDGAVKNAKVISLKTFPPSTAQQWHVILNKWGKALQNCDSSGRVPCSWLPAPSSPHGSRSGSPGPRKADVQFLLRDFH